jgi:hypothetical protein
MITNKHREKFGENQLKGINLVVKATAKKYPFIIGWELPKGWDNYSNITQISLIIDLDKVGEYYDIEMDDYWLNKWKDKSEFQETSFIFTLSKSNRNESMSETKKIRETLSKFYERLPDEFASFYFYEYSGEEYKGKSELLLKNFINTPTQEIYYSI